MANRILVVEDDTAISELICMNLEVTGYEVVPVLDGNEVEGTLEKEEDFDLALLDIMLPDEDGLQILKKLRLNHKTVLVPVIMVTAKTTELDKVKGLDLGADDYLSKPFGVMELISRVKAVLRRVERQRDERPQKVVHGAIEMDVKKHEILVNGEPVQLTLKEFELLRRLLEHPNIVLTRSQLLEEIWGYDFDGETRTVDVHIRTLRQKLGTAGDMIETVRGVGYRISE